MFPFSPLQYVSATERKINREVKWGERERGGPVQEEGVTDLSLALGTLDSASPVFSGGSFRPSPRSCEEEGPKDRAKGLGVTRRHPTWHCSPAGDQGAESRGPSGCGLPAAPSNPPTGPRQRPPTRSSQEQKHTHPRAQTHGRPDAQLARTARSHADTDTRGRPAVHTIVGTRGCGHSDTPRGHSRTHPLGDHRLDARDGHLRTTHGGLRVPGGAEV